MVAGSLATVAVIIVAATQIPRWRRTGAVEAPAAGVTAPVVAVPESGETPPPAASETPRSSPAENPAPPPAAEKPAASERRSEPVSARPSASRTPALATPKPPQQPAGTARQQPRPPAASPAGGAGAPVPRAAQLPAPSPAPAAKPAAARAVPETGRTAESSPAPVRAASNEGALRKVRERMMLMAVRVGAARSSLDNLRRAQNASGLGLRADMAAAEKRMEFFLDEAESSLKSGDAGAADKRLDAAEQELEKLERFLGI